jgi:hypothetical protein
MDYSRFNYVAQPEDSIPWSCWCRASGRTTSSPSCGNKADPGAARPMTSGPRSTSGRACRIRFRGSAGARRTRTADPFDMTEAVGDEDAVKSSTLGMRNLERVANSLLAVAERPGQNYDLLNELYSQRRRAVGPLQRTRRRADRRRGDAGNATAPGRASSRSPGATAGGHRLPERRTRSACPMFLLPRSCAASNRTAWSAGSGRRRPAS